MTCLTELILSNEPKLETELKFKNSLFKAIDAGDMTFPAGSGVVYSSSPRAISVVPGVVESEVEEPGGPVDGGDNSNDGSKNWVVPVSITVAVVGILILVFLVGYFVSNRKRNEAEIVSLDGESLSGDLKEPDVHVRRGSLRHLVVEQGDEDTAAKSKQDGKNPFFAAVSSSSGTSSSKKSKRSKKSASSSPSSSSSSSSNISSSTEDLEEKNSRDIGMEGLGQTTGLGQSKESNTSMYRAGVEALLKESAPEELENLDELMNEYAGREEELIGQLSSMLATMNRASNVGLEQEDDGTPGSSVSSMTDHQEHASAPSGYNEVQGQITSALDGKAPTEVGQDNRKAAAAAAAATLFTGVSTKNMEMGEWSSESDSDDSSGSSSSSSNEGSSEWSTDEGFSSMDTSLETNGSEVVNTTPSMLAAIGVAESITKQVGVNDVGSLSSKSDDENNATRQELSQAIQGRLTICPYLI